MAYFFKPEEMDALMRAAGMDGSCSVISRELSNKKEGLSGVMRLFVQGVYYRKFATTAT